MHTSFISKQLFSLIPDDLRKEIDRLKSCFVFTNTVNVSKAIAGAANTMVKVRSLYSMFFTDKTDTVSNIQTLEFHYPTIVSVWVNDKKYCWYIVSNLNHYIL